MATSAIFSANLHSAKPAGYGSIRCAAFSVNLSHLIQPRIGLAPLEFGMTRIEVRDLVGEPSSVDVESVPGWETWEYSYYGLEVTFCEDADWRCTYLSTAAPAYLLAGKVVLGRAFSDLIRVAATLELGRCEPELDPDLGETMRFPESDVDICFDSGVSEYVNWSAEIDENDEYVFPRLTNAA